MPSKPLRRSKKLSRHQALSRAKAHICHELLGKSPRIVDSRYAEVRAYNVDTKNAWVIYKVSKEIAFKSSEVIVVCKRTGKVIYEGAAGDEG